MRAVVEGLSEDLKNVVIVPFCHSESNISLKSSHGTNSKSEIFMSEFLSIGKDVPKRDELKYEQLPFYHPLFIMYSSGTTGKPKCIVSLSCLYVNLISNIFFVKLLTKLLNVYLINFQVHGAGGTLMKHLEEHLVQGNRSDQDVLLYYTTTGRDSKFIISSYKS